MELALLIPILALSIPIVAIWTSHQQKMMQLRYGMPQQQNSADIEALRHEVKELKELVHTQMLTIDSLSNRTRSADDDLSNRLGAGR